jgi:hypothetical protein
MIVQERDGELWLFRQTDHALLSGAFATAWGNDVISRPTHRESTLIAASRHDDGWSDWELEPRADDEGRPVDFIHISVAEHTALYRRGIDIVEGEDAYAGLLVSMHGERLYTRPFEPGMDPRIERLHGDDLRLATEYVEHERSRQRRIAGGEPDADAEEGWRLLQVWDRLSLLVCMQPLRNGTSRALPPIATASGDVQIEARATAEGALILRPYPFDADPAKFTIAMTVSDRTAWTDTSSFRTDFRAGQRAVLSFACRAGL